MSEVDKDNMKQTILEFPGQFNVGYSAGNNTKDRIERKRFDNIVIAGMGGSALPGALLNMFSDGIGLKIPVYVHRSYGLPKEAGDKSLVFIISYSGNTEEALSAYKKAQTENYDIAAITSGGELEKLAKKDGVPVALVPKDIQPRIALGFQFSALMSMLADAGTILSQEKEIKELSSSLDAEQIEKNARDLAEKIGEKTPLIYASESNVQLAYILKIQMNENAKRHAFYNYFPELNHNEMVGYNENAKGKMQKVKDFFVLMLRDKDDHPRIQKRMQLTADIIKKRGFEIEYIDIEGDNMYNKAFNTILFGNWLSYYLAINAGIDPTPVNIVEEFKKEL